MNKRDMTAKLSDYLMIEARKIKEKEKMVFTSKSVLTKTDVDCVYIATL